MKEVMLTLIGPDRTGIVARMAGIVEADGGNWLDSRMIRMGGYFSGILRIAIPEENISDFGGRVFVVRVVRRSRLFCHRVDGFPRGRGCHGRRTR